MKNIVKVCLMFAAISSLTACMSGTPSGKLDSVANHNNPDSSSTTVDTLPKADTAKTDSVKK